MEGATTVGFVTDGGGPGLEHLAAHAGSSVSPERYRVMR